GDPPAARALRRARAHPLRDGGAPAARGGAPHPAAGRGDGPHLPRPARRAARARLPVPRSRAAPLEAAPARDRRRHLARDRGGAAAAPEARVVSDELRVRKLAHLELCATGDVEARRSTLLEEVHLLHEALPELAWHEVDLSVELFGRTLHAPLVISGMTGGAPAARAVNRALATAAQKLGLAVRVRQHRAQQGHG